MMLFATSHTPASKIFSMRNSLQMGRSNAQAHTTQVVEFKAKRDSAKDRLIREFMCLHSLVGDRGKSPVALAPDRSRPKPALPEVWREGGDSSFPVDLLPKALLDGAGVANHLYTEGVPRRGPALVVEVTQAGAFGDSCAAIYHALCGLRMAESAARQRITVAAQAQVVPVAHTGSDSATGRTTIDRTSRLLKHLGTSNSRCREPGVSASRLPSIVRLWRCRHY